MLRLFNIGGAADAGGTGDESPHGETLLLDALSDALVTSDASNRITYANLAAVELFDRGRDKLIGLDLLSLFGRESRDAIRFAQSAARDGLPQRYDAGLVGEEITVSICAAPLTHDGRNEGTIL